MQRLALMMVAVLVATIFAPLPSIADDFAFGPDSCRDGYVWREAAPLDRVCVLPSSRSRAWAENALAVTRVDPLGAYGPFSCMVGYVWREAFRGDAVCVTPARRTAVARENAEAPRHRTRD